jgi:hypothetical protein
MVSGYAVPTLIRGYRQEREGPGQRLLCEVAAAPRLSTGSLVALVGILCALLHLVACALRARCLGAQR